MAMPATNAAARADDGTLEAIERPDKDFVLDSLGQFGRVLLRERSVVGRQLLTRAVK